MFEGLKQTFFDSCVQISSKSCKIFDLRLLIFRSSVFLVCFESISFSLIFNIYVFVIKTSINLVKFQENLKRKTSNSEKIYGNIDSNRMTSEFSIF
jgi:hypothetical protein